PAPGAVEAPAAETQADPGTVPAPRPRRRTAAKPKAEMRDAAASEASPPPQSSPAEGERATPKPRRRTAKKAEPTVELTADETAANGAVEAPTQKRGA